VTRGRFGMTRTEAIRVLLTRYVYLEEKIEQRRAAGEPFGFLTDERKAIAMGIRALQESKTRDRQVQP